MSDFLQGATALASLGVALFFLKYWRRTHDRLFAAFAAAFLVFSINRVVLSAIDEDDEARTYVYLIRAAVFVLIAGAVLDKNVRRSRR